jgi:molybdenum cofactor biosynthesis enzyme MoaA
MGNVSEIPGCMSCHSLYIKANGEVPCWDDAGEANILFQVSEEFLERPNSKLFHHASFIQIRRAFRQDKLPFVDYCSRCAVRGCGSVAQLKPKSLEVLHLEPSYLCHLSCPQCIPAVDRKLIKSPPYHMSPVLLDKVLTKLKNEGVLQIPLIHFEGRGDPLTSPHIAELVYLTRKYYPTSVIGLTTHGNFRFNEWIIKGGLDWIRLSIDGASPLSYKQYRVGGDFNKVMRFVEELVASRSITKSKLDIEWKYILFEWNDSESELQRAAELADKFNIRLIFTLTHTPGRSKRFTSVTSLASVIRELAPRSEIDSTVNLKIDASERMKANNMTGEYVHRLLLASLQEFIGGRKKKGMDLLKQALGLDPGITPSALRSSGSNLIEACKTQILGNVKYPSTLSALAAICRTQDALPLSQKLLERYLEIAPNAPDRLHVKADLAQYGASANLWQKIRILNFS